RHDALRQPLGFRPVVVDDRSDLGLEELPQLREYVLLTVGEAVLESVEVTGERGERHGASLRMLRADANGIGTLVQQPRGCAGRMFVEITNEPRDYSWGS